MGEQIKNENEGMRRKLYQLNEMTQRVNEYEERMQTLGRENQQLNIALDKRNKESMELEARVAEGENLARQFNKIKEDFRKISG